MNNRLNLFREVAKRFSRTKSATSSRKLYTDSIYPYPNAYFNNVVFPSQMQYRETWKDAPFSALQTRFGNFMFTSFWTYFFYNLFKDPGALVGHHVFPDPANWTDEELGIPPDSMGSYVDWLDKKMGESGANTQ